uniref:Tubulin folding cofactor A n=1 Tax=Ovis aries TaxID=9940 RepID=A0AC11E266_SHEEP
MHRHRNWSIFDTIPLQIEKAEPSLRLVKEKMMYEKEAKQQEEKIEKMKAEDGENYAIKKQAEILQESRMMIPDCQRRLEAAHTDLLQLLVSTAYLSYVSMLFQSNTSKAKVLNL